MGEGKELFRKHYAACHGSDGDGGVGVPLSLPLFVNHVGDEYLVKTIRHGQPGRVTRAIAPKAKHFLSKSVPLVMVLLARAAQADAASVPAWPPPITITSKDSVYSMFRL